MLNAAIVGLGRWGQNLTNSIQNKSEKIRIVQGVVRHPEKVEDYAKKQGFTIVKSLQEALANPQVEAIILATPHSLHAEQIIACAKAGKPVFTEKPFTLTTESAKAAVAACAAAKITLGVGYNWRFQPALQAIKQLLTEGKLGKLLHIEGNFNGPSVYRVGREHWRQDREEGPAGGMTGRGVHVVDAMLYLAGPIESVYAQSHRFALDYGTDDTTTMLFKFRGGGTGYLGTVIATAETWRLQVCGSRGWAEVGDVQHLNTWQLRTCFFDPNDPYVHPQPQVTQFPDTSTERLELENFADAVKNNRPLAIQGGEDIHNVTVLESILQSVTSGQAVKIA
jgi:predicted dehydrogenase